MDSTRHLSPGRDGKLARARRDLEIPTLPTLAGRNRRKIARRALEAAKSAATTWLLLDPPARTPLDEELDERGGRNPKPRPIRIEVLLVADA